MKELFTVASYDYPTEMFSAKAILESAGIEYVVTNELAAQILPHHSQGAGGAKLKVRKEDLIEAMKLVDSTGYERLDPNDEKPHKLERTLLISLALLLLYAVYYFWKTT